MMLPTRYDLEAQLFSILTSFVDLEQKVQSGDFSIPFYRKSIRVKLTQFHLIELILKKKGMEIYSILEEMKLANELQTMIRKLQDSILFKDLKLEHRTKNSSPEKLFSFELDTDLTNSYKNPELENSISILEDKASRLESYVLLSDKPTDPVALAKISSDITSDFITVLDFFQLKLKDYSLLMEIWDNLSSNIKLFPGMEELSLDISMLAKEKEKVQEMDYQTLHKTFERFYFEFKKKLIS